MASSPKKSNDPRKLFRQMVSDLTTQAKTGRSPWIDIPVRSLSNVKFNKTRSIIEIGREKQRRLLFNVAHARKYMQTFLVASGCDSLLDQGKTTSIRDLYYMLKHTIAGAREETFDEQEESDPIIEDLEVALGCLREEFNLFASNRGSMVGAVTIRDSGDTIDCRRQGSGGWSIPSIVEEKIVEFVKTEADFVLLVEKDAVWRRLNEDKFWKKFPCVLITGQGMAPRGVRRLVYRMNAELGLPLYVLVDNDPWGFYIYSVIKQGSINLAFESSRMAVPTARFLGLSSFDRDEYELPSNVTIALNKQDISRAKQIINYPWFQDKRWQKEIQKMLKDGVKLELEALSKKGISFVSETYLPEKIGNKKYLD